MLTMCMVERVSTFSGQWPKRAMDADQEVQLTRPQDSVELGTLLMQVDGPGQRLLLQLVL